MSSNGSISAPEAPPDSPGSSVSTRLMDEYEELLKYAVVVPSYDTNKLPKTLTDARDSFPQVSRETLVTVTREVHDDDNRDISDSEVIVKVTRENGLPDFGQSPITSKDIEDMMEEAESERSFPGKQAHQNTDDQKEDRISKPLFTRAAKDLRQELNLSGKDGSEYEVENIYTSAVDPDISKMENLLDQWTLDLKRNVLAEYSQSKIRIVELQRQQLLKEREKHAADKIHLQNELENMKELLHTYETSIARKDEVISNMTHALQKQKEKYEMLGKFSSWKIRHNDNKRENFASQLAAKHYERSLTQKVWDGWHSVIESKWRTRVEKACQGKAQEVCMQLTNSYESKIASLNEALEASRQEVTKLHRERDHYEEAMKKAFMRGVCALNLEAMTMFQQGEEKQSSVQNASEGGPEDISGNMVESFPEKEFGGPKTIPTEPIFVSQTRSEGPPAKVISSQGPKSHLSSMAQSRAVISSKTSTSGSQKGKVISAKISAKVDTGRQNSGLGGSERGSLAPPMSSVIVERHQPVTKQTIGQATASKHPSSRTTLSDYQHSGIIHRRIAGQAGVVNMSPNVQTVKVVD